MLRILLATVLLTLPTVASAQTAPLLTGYRRPLPIVPIDSVTHQISYQGNLVVPGVPQAELYGRAQEWLATQFENYAEVVQLADPGRGVLIGQAIVRAVAPAQKNQDSRSFKLLFRFRLRAQPGALHYELTDISYPTYPETDASNSAESGRAVNGLALWQRADDFSQIGTTDAQNRRAPVEIELRDYDQYTDQGQPKPRMVQQCQGIQNAMTTLLASLGQRLKQPLP
ncbi:DUF4468 domain-containing protein [Hymenobacter metallilatus]|uniref:DUF4468 domain-containing protein n=1 Tax=Hymenobacter metallilatus TaxID=2493666 RepID=A0A3R9MGT7_9BACT|nr:DUF4468 domain-containing protein [Hymenobacter metallilatus]RSK31106.1 DUF4468 domain-containing protein [Hymenobacter metallilatus]